MQLIVAVACLVGIKGGTSAGNVHVLEMGGHAWMVTQQDIKESCARCRAIDKESWAIYKNLGTNKTTAVILLSLLAEKGELEDPSSVERFGKKLPSLELHDEDSIIVIDKTAASSNHALQQAYDFVAKHLVK